MDRSQERRTQLAARERKRLGLREKTVAPPSPPTPDEKEKKTKEKQSTGRKKRGGEVEKKEAVRVARALAFASTHLRRLDPANPGGEEQEPTEWES